MSEEFIAVIHGIGVTVFKLLPVTIALGVVFAVLSFFWACNPGRPWWRKRQLVTDICYWIVIPLFARFLRIGLLVMGAALLFGITSADGLVEFYDNGHGPLALYLLQSGAQIKMPIGIEDGEHVRVNRCLSMFAREKSEGEPNELVFIFIILVESSDENIAGGLAGYGQG